MMSFNCAFLFLIRRMTTLSKYLDLEAIQGEDPSNNYANLSPQTVEQVKINIQLL